MIIEGLCTTQNKDGVVNIAPMGPIVNEDLTSFFFRPFQSSTTFQNLKETGCGVFHVTDDVGLIARAAIGKLESLPELLPAKEIDGHVIASACRWYEFQVESIDESSQRSEITTNLQHVGHLRDYWGQNRARNVILEAAILCTRLHILDADEVSRQFEGFEIIVEKTASPTDAETFQLLKSYVSSYSK
ncbi:DUF447 family protein [Planctomicrobium sp.]|nr:DUF447 domain-containing protein [Planctomicrobium sp.]MBT5020976.1 DUF447 family protein [Planctomicrobium sp.]MDB4731881.1 DUF447 family protein [bacterium]MDB4733238.1 DUF447 family protein [Planctomicrobium sp.]